MGDITLAWFLIFSEPKFCSSDETKPQNRLSRSLVHTPLIQGYCIPREIKCPVLPPKTRPPKSGRVIGIFKPNTHSIQIRAIRYAATASIESQCGICHGLIASRSKRVSLIIFTFYSPKTGRYNK